MRPLPESENSFGLKMPISKHVPPLLFLTTSAVYSAQRFAGLLHPAPTIGFVWFHHVGALRLRRRFPRTRCTPRSFSLSGSWSKVTDPKVVHPMPIPSRRYVDFRPTCCHVIFQTPRNLRVLRHQKVRCESVVLPLLVRPILPGLMA